MAMARSRRAAASNKTTSSASTAGSTENPSQTRRSMTTRTVIPDSDDIAPEEDEDLPDGPTQSLKAVVIPEDSRGFRLRTRNSLASAASSTRGSGFSTRANSSEYETPVTSAMTTPVDSTRTARTKASNSLLTSMNKRRRRSAPTQPQEESDDARLALQLQAEEYGAEEDDEQPISGTRRRGTSFHRTSDDSEDEDAELSSAPSDLSDEVPLNKRRKVSAQRGKAMASAAAGSRARIAAPRRRRMWNEVKSQQTTPADSVVHEDANDHEGDGDYSELVSNADPSNEVSEFSELAEFQDDSAEDSETGGVESFRDFGRRIRQQKKQTRKERERFKLERAHPELMTMWQDLADIPKIPTEQVDQPTAITRKLKSFQLEGLNWMIKQEQTQWKGGLLGDEMGMGKTIQAVSLIMSDHPQKEPTLVVVPPVALMQWTNEIRDYTDGKLNVLVYHGTNSKAKNLTVKQLKAFDVIMISYSGLESVYRKETKGWTRQDKIVKEDSAIHSIHFHRLILDEAHSIKQRTTGVARACFALKGTYKWCLSGTPVQNRIGEFFSLLRFLEVQPFANYFCKTCSCSSLHWETTVDHKCKNCNHRLLEHVSVFNQEILNPIISGEGDAVRREALNKLRLITDRIMLRRMKRDQTASMELPPKEVVIHNEFFGEIERDFSSSIMTNTGRQFDTYVSRGVMLNNYANIFGLIMQMRQVADHPDLLLKKHAEGGQNVLVCNICDEPAEEAIRSRCRHEFCRACVKDYVNTCEASGATPDCPRCHIALAIDFEQPDIEQDEEGVKKSSIINRIKMENWTSSTKIEMLVYELYKLRSKKQTLKSIVFSQFTSMLQLIEWRLRRAGFNTVMLDGSMSPQQRQKSIDYFMNNTNVEVFLVSLKAGGVALNLTEASRIFIVDPWWNPAAEWQSADRCHRIGQKRPCVITRLCIEDSVESRIVMLQEKKAQMINGTVNNDDVALDKLTPEDMQFLFRGS